jgi:F-type H+-transporting ATPase subunit delta
LGRVAIRYSKALFELALEKKVIDEVSKDLEMIRNICYENEGFYQSLDNPVIEEKTKSAILKDLFEENINPLTYKFLQLLSKKRRSGFLLDIIDYYLQRVREHQGILSCSLISPQPMDLDQTNEIKKRVEEMTGKKVIFNHLIDDTVLGGFIVKIKDTVIDLSIKTQLEKMRSRLVNG